MMLNEAFKRLNALDEDVFTFDNDGIKDLSSFMSTDDEDVIDIVDMDAEKEDELQDSYVGKVILDCCVCHTKIYKDKSDVVVDDETELANIDMECPYCYSSEGYKIVGEVAEFDADSDKEDDEEVEEEEEEPKVDSDVEETEEVEEEQTVKESFLRKAKHRRMRTVKENINNLSLDTDDTHMEMTSDEGGKVTITTEPITTEAEHTESFETIKPISDEVEAEIEAEDTEENEPVSMEDAEAEDEIDIDLDDIDEETFSDMGESFLKSNYFNVKSFKATSSKIDGNKIFVEGVINFRNGLKKKTNFVFEAKDARKDGMVRFVGDNKQLTEGMKAFTLTGKVSNKKFVSESLKYNFMSNGKKVHGMTRKGKRG